MPFPAVAVTRRQEAQAGAGAPSDAPPGRHAGCLPPCFKKGPETCLEKAHSTREGFRCIHTQPEALRARAT